MKFDLLKASAIAEIFSSIAIVVTVLYLAVQTNQNTEALLSSNRQALLDSELEYLYRLIEHDIQITPGLNATIDPLLAEEINSKTLMAAALFRMRESQFIQYAAGSLDESLWLTYKVPLIRLIKTDEVYEATWRYYSVGFDASFVELINNEIVVTE